MNQNPEQLFLPETHREYREQLIADLFDKEKRGEITREELQIKMVELLIESDNRAITDTLTGLPNLKGFKDALDLEFKQIEAGIITGGILVFLDGDGIKKINDGPGGHAAGDKAILCLSKAVFSSAGISDLVGRFGGDEFLFWCPNSTIPEVIQKILEMKKEAVKSCSDFPEVSFSCGIVPYSSSTTPEALIEIADQTMYDAKMIKRGSIAIFGIEDQDNVTELQKTLEDQSWNTVNIITTHIPRP